MEIKRVIDILGGLLAYVSPIYSIIRFSLTRFNDFFLSGVLFCFSANVILTWNFINRSFDARVCMKHKTHKNWKTGNNTGS